MNSKSKSVYFANLAIILLGLLSPLVELGIHLSSSGRCP